MQFVGAPEAKELHMGFPVPTLGFINGLKLAINYLPVAIPFGILTVIGGINVTESARVAGDDFKTRDILLTEAIATLIAGVCGGVAQSTPYIGQPAYKSMGAKSGYTLLTGLFIGIGGMFGIISYIVELIPAAVLAPILLFVALDIMTQAYLACPKEHAPAVSFAFVPTVARLVVIKLMAFLPSAMFAEKLVFVGQGVEARMLPELMVTVALGNGFIVTGMLWGAFLALLIDRKLIMAANYLFIMAFLSFFGIIHSGMADGNMYLPWLLQFPVNQIPYQFAMGYAVLGIVILFLSLTKASKEPVEPMHI